MDNRVQQGIVPPGRGLPTRHFRNAACSLESRPYFDAAHAAGAIAVHGFSTTGRTLALGGGPLDVPRQVIDFVRCSYLGLDNHPLIIAGAIEALESHRSLDWSCARTELNFDLLAELEAALSKVFCARVITFSSGTLANLAAMPILASGRLTDGRKPLVAFDGFSDLSLAYHKSIVGHETRTETIVSIDALERLCRENADVIYVCDGIYSMGGYSPIDELRRLQERYGLFLYIDDSHGLSIFGNNGEGFARSQFPQVLGERTVIAASLGNGFGASGGILMLGTVAQETLIRRYSVPYAISSPPNSATLGAALASCKLHRSSELGERQGRLSQRIELFDRRLATVDQGNSLPIRMIVIGSEAKAIEIARGLLDRDFYALVTFLRAAGEEKAGIRVCITAEHEVRDLERLCDCILELVAGITGKPYPLR
ncbi:aminotransferase class I/II-fold pyridoxal phosphate-dependent enzyme [Bradyrhizobium sp. CAR08]